MTRRTREQIGELSPDRIRELNRLAERPDREIDTSEIPEASGVPPNVIRGKDWHLYRGKTIVLSDELHAYFSALADRRRMSINELVNDFLAKEVALVESVR